MFQEKKIYVYSFDRSDYHDPILIVNEFDSVGHLSCAFNEKQFRYLFTDYEGIHRLVGNAAELENKLHMSAWRMKYFAAYDEDGKWYAPDLLIGLAREIRRLNDLWWIEKRKHDKYRKAQGKKKRALGNVRMPPIYRLIRNAYHDPDALELGIKFANTKKQRDAKALCVKWDDDVYRINDKSWKTQSKRKRQWK